MAKCGRVVELVGPPGSGKTTLARELVIRASQLTVAKCPYFRRISYFPFFAGNLLRLLPSLLVLQTESGGGRLALQDIALMTILSGWHRMLRQQIQDADTIILLDEGAITLLARLHCFGSGTVRGQGAREWWNSIYGRWADTLDVAIWLDTPVPVLLKRIRKREMQYELGVMADEFALQHLSKIRAAQETALGTLVAKTRLTVLHFNTIEKLPQQICDEVLHALELGIEPGSHSDQ